MTNRTKIILEEYNKNPKKCEECSEFIKFKSGDKLHKFLNRKFCSLTCSRNYITRTRTKLTKCKECKVKINNKSTLCRTCFNIKNNPINEKTLGDFIQGEKYLSSKCQGIRKDARMKMQKWFPLENRKCKYCLDDEFKQVLEVHHIKGILTFDIDTKIKHINNIDNLIWVCPSHHAMLEKGLLV